MGVPEDVAGSSVFEPHILSESHVQPQEDPDLPFMPNENESSITLHNL